MEDQPQPETPEAANPEPVEQQGDPGTLADPGKRALDAERKRAAAAEKTAKALQQQLDALEAERLSKEERAVKDAAEAAKRAEAAERDALRWKIAARNGISDEDAELFLTGADEETLTAQAERLKALAPKPMGNHIPSLGNRPQSPASLADQITAAEQSGDHRAAMALKAQQLANLARAQR